jgi:hypothetical protein
LVIFMRDRFSEAYLQSSGQSIIEIHLAAI